MDKRSDLLGPSPYPGETPQAQSDAAQDSAAMGMPDVRHDYTVAPEEPPRVYNWSMSATHVSVSDDDHALQFSVMGWTDYNRPYAYGTVEVLYNWTANWNLIYSNMSLHMVEKRLKRYTKDQGWEFGGLADREGMLIKSASLKSASVPGIGEINPGLKDWKNDEWSGMGQYDNPGDHQTDTPFYGFQDYDEDVPMTDPRTCSECGELCLDYDDWRKHVLRKHVNPDRLPAGSPQPVVDLDDVLPAGFDKTVMDKTVQRQSRLIHQLTAERPRNYVQSAISEIPVVATSDEISGYEESRARIEVAEGTVYITFITPIASGVHNETFIVPYAVLEEGAGTAHYETGEPTAFELRQEGQDVVLDTVDAQFAMPAQSFWEAIRGRTSAVQAPMIPGPIPFIYDIETDRIYVGHPGERHSDIKGRFTPGGIVEGQYDPKGNVQIRTDTDMPYTVRHMAELWYAMHPELAIKNIFLLVGDKRYKLASANIGHRVRNIAAADPAAWAAFQALEPLGNVYAVGGAVRDIVLGKTPKDVDLMVQGVPAEDVERALEQLPGRVDYTGKQFGVFRYRDPEGNEVEIAMPRTERSTGPGHRDFEVFTDPYISVGEDLARRDFTGNAMAVNLSTGDLVDPYHGSEDLKSGVLRTVSDRSFIEDPLRILRAFGSVSRHGLDPSPETYHDLAAHAGLLGELPKERLQMELDKLMSGSDPAKAIDLMEATGVLQHVLPDVAATVGFDQKNPHHDLLLSDHLKEVLQRVAAKTDDVDVRWAALLHDIGKPASQWVDENGIGHYYESKDGLGADHEKVGAEMAQRLLTELKFPTDRIDRIRHLIRHHMFPAFNSQAGARKFINRVGDEHADDLLLLRHADQDGKGTEESGQNVPLMGQYVQHVRETGQPTSLKNLAINGNDLIQAGFKPGPEMGALLKHLTDLVLEDPSLNEKQTLLALADQSRDVQHPESGRTATRDVKFSGTKTLQANILDPIKDELDPDVFNHPGEIAPTVKPKIAEWVKKKVYKTMIDAGWPDPSQYLDLILTGSLTTYQWSEESDFDVSLWVNVERFPEWVRADLIAMMIEKCDGTIVPGTTHPIQCFVVDPTKFQKEDLYKPGLRSGYDLDKGDWLVLPERDRSIDVSKRWPEHIMFARMCADKMKMMLRYDKYAVKIYWDFIHRQRFLEQRAGKGDYSLWNIVYKMLSNDNLFPEISRVTGEHIAYVNEDL